MKRMLQRSSRPHVVSWASWRAVSWQLPRLQKHGMRCWPTRRHAAAQAAAWVSAHSSSALGSTISTCGRRNWCLAAVARSIEKPICNYGLVMPANNGAQGAQALYEHLPHLLHWQHTPESVQHSAHIVPRHCVLSRVRSPDDARDTFKTLKNQHIGDASAALYHEWACLEHSAGHVSKALAVIAKGLKAEAQPARYGTGVCKTVVQTQSPAACTKNPVLLRMAHSCAVWAMQYAHWCTHLRCSGLTPFPPPCPAVACNA